jgi:serine phosphatase RsbU (regulator of sigma subunit)
VLPSLIMTAVPPLAALSALARAHERELTVLVVEDDDGDALLVTEILHDGLPDARVRRARDLAEAEAMLDDVTSCVLLDLGLPDARGTIGVVRLQEHRPGVAIVVLTGGDDEALGMRAVAAGAQDYLVKGRTDERVLARSILYAVERQRAEESARRLYEAERRRIHNDRMTRALLPRPVLRSGCFELSVAYRPGNEGSELGGDFYDAVELADGSLRVVIGDVSGHGPDEAALGASLRAAWRGLVMAGLATPAALAALDRLLRTERHEPHGFVTLCAVDIDPSHQMARLCLAGHPPPFLLDEGALVVPDRPRGPLLGVVSDAEWPVNEIALPPSWSLLLFTDGLIEGFADPVSQDRLGEQATLEIVDGLHRAGARGTTLVDSLVAEVEARHGGPLIDDVAVCLVEGTWR